mgnify:CR=1 FL=1
MGVASRDNAAAYVGAERQKRDWSMEDRSG